MLIGQEITVLGAGIAGLSAATALARRGARVRVLERAEEIGEFGAGLQISPNGSRVLAALDLEAELAALCPRSRAVCLRDFRRGTQVLRLPLPGVVSILNEPPISLALSCIPMTP